MLSHSKCFDSPQPQAAPSSGLRLDVLRVELGHVLTASECIDLVCNKYRCKFEIQAPCTLPKHLLMNKLLTTAASSRQEAQHSLLEPIKLTLRIAGRAGQTVFSKAER